jgi:ABC-type antimicrobial peptide transport system permease subunit
MESPPEVRRRNGCKHSMRHPWLTGTLRLARKKHADATSFPECTSSRLDRRGHDVDNKIPITDIAPLNEWVSRSITDQRVIAQLSSFFGLLAIFLSAIGIYGLMPYVVSRRTNEIGIRMALGAERMHVRWLVMREVLLLVVLGIAIGAPAALFASKLVASLLLA